MYVATVGWIHHPHGDILRTRSKNPLRKKKQKISRKLLEKNGINNPERLKWAIACAVAGTIPSMTGHVLRVHDTSLASLYVKV